MDIKLGALTAEPGASSDKVSREAAKSRHQAALGFRVVGAIYHRNRAPGGIASIGKAEGVYSLSVGQVLWSGYTAH